MNFNSNKKVADLAFGLKGEADVIELLQLKYGKDLKKTATYDCFDFENKEFLIELKTRRNTLLKYDTTIVSFNRIEYLNELELKGNIKKAVFAFNFTDGLYYINYDKELFKTFYKDVRERCDRGFNEKKCYLYIPVSQLCRYIV